MNTYVYRSIYALVASVAVVSIYRYLGGDPLTGFIAVGIIIGAILSPKISIIIPIMISVSSILLITTIGFIISISLGGDLSIISIVSNVAGIPSYIMIIVYLGVATVVAVLTTIVIISIKGIVSKAKI